MREAAPALRSGDDPHAMQAFWRVDAFRRAARPRGGDDMDTYLQAPDAVVLERTARHPASIRGS
jgi:hypothetical protein